MTDPIDDSGGDWDGPFAPHRVDPKADCGIDGFAAVDMRVGIVKAVEEFPEARRPAWKLSVDFGPVIGELQTSAQITNYPRDALLGRRVVGAINLGRKRIAGFESQFLVLGALEPDGTVKLLEVHDRIPPGAPIA